MVSIRLLEEENDLKNKIQCNLKRLFDRRRLELNRQEILRVILENAKYCLELHKSLKARGYPPIHSKYMIRNRKVHTSESLQFYKHVHPQEDLIKFIDNPRSNIEDTNKPDKTMGVEFKIDIYSCRWGHDDCYILQRNIDGWYFSNLMEYEGQCNFEGDPYLYKALEHDDIAYPHDIRYYLSSIWQRADNGESLENVQDMLNKIADWINNTERSSPRDILI